MCKYNHELCQYDLRGLSKYEINQHYFEFIKNAPRNDYKKYSWDSHTRGIYKCKICGELHFIRNDRFKNNLVVCKNKCNGNVYGDNNITVVIGYNNIAIEHPHIIKYFVNKEDVFKYTSKSDVRVQLKCPHCNKIKSIKTIIANLTKQGFSCEFCSDNIPYPEKVMALILKDLGIEFEIQYRIEGYNKYRYDFYLIKYNTIIEVHGEQHYKYTGFARSYEDEHENDLIKYDIAILNGYEYNKNYFIVDCRKSNIKWIGQHIIKCLFFQQFNLNNINWQEIDIKAQNSLIMEVCEYWNKQRQISKDFTTYDLENVFKFDVTTIRKWLKWGNDNDLCEYNAKEERKAKERRQSKFVYLIKPNGTKWYDKVMSQHELARLTGISYSTIYCRANDGKPLISHSKTKYDSKYIDSYVVEEDKLEEFLLNLKGGDIIE